MRYLLVLLMCLPVMGATNYVGIAQLGAGAMRDPPGKSGTTIIVTNAGMVDAPAAQECFYIGSTSIGVSNVTVICTNKWTVILTNSFRTQPTVYMQASGCTLDGFVVVGSWTAPGILVPGHTNTIRNCWVHHNGGGGGGSSSGLEAHDLYETVIENNLIEYNGAGANGHGIYANGTNVVISGNISRFNHNSGAQVYRSNDENTNGNSFNLQFYNNLIYSNQTYGIIFGDHRSNHMAVFNNTIAQPGGTLIYRPGNGGFPSFPYNQVVCLTNNILVYDTFEGSSVSSEGTYLFGVNYTNSAFSLYQFDVSKFPFFPVDYLVLQGTTGISGHRVQVNYFTDSDYVIPDITNGMGVVNLLQKQFWISSYTNRMDFSGFTDAAASANNWRTNNLAPRFYYMRATNWIETAGASVFAAPSRIRSASFR